MNLLRWFVVLSLFALVGCGRGQQGDFWPSLERFRSETQASNNLRQFGLAAGEQADRIEGRSRKLVYHAEVDLLVEDLAATERDLHRLVQGHGGVLANSETVTDTGMPRAGLWRVRVPVDQFEAFLQAVGGVGEVLRSKRDVQDVTQSYSELEEQIKNLDSEADGLRELLKRPPERLADALAAREHLSKVTREREGLKARLKRMQAQAEYSTVVVRFRERKGYTSETAAPLGTTLSRALGDSWDAFVAFGRGAVIVAVMLVPWTPLLAVGGGLAWLLVRRRARRRAVAA
jgi:hypothetical protein